MAEIQFTGNVAADAELRHTRSGEPVLSVRVCDSKSRKTETGWETLAETWYNVALYGPAAQALQHEVRKGARVKVAGEFYTREYQGKNGPGVSNDVTATGIKVLPSHNQQGGFGGATPDRNSGWGAPAGDQGSAFGGPNGPTKGADADPWTGSSNGGWGA